MSGVAVRELFARLGFQVDDSGLQRFNNGINNLKSNLIDLRNQLKGVNQDFNSFGRRRLRIQNPSVDAGKLNQSLAQTRGRVEQIGSSFLNLRTIIGGVVTIAGGIVTGKFAQELLSANREFESLMARLRVLEGSTAKAESQFEKLQRLAVNTPFQLNELTDGYIRLQAAGFDASESNITALGDLAVASGKGFQEIVETILSANRGLGAMVDNFAGLSGRAEKGGLLLKNARTGVEELVKTGDTKALLNFFTTAGKAPGILGGMAEQMKTLNGRISNIKDNIFKFFVAVGQAGFTGALSDLLLEISNGIEGGDSLAKKLGVFLGNAIRKTTEIVRYAKKEWLKIYEVLKIISFWLTGTRIGFFLSGFAKSAFLFIKSIGGFKALIPILFGLGQAVAPILLLVTTLTTLALVIEDIYFFMTGGKSLIGEFFKKFEKSNEPIGRFARFLKSGLDGLKQFYMTIKALGSRLLEQIMPDLEELKFEGEAILNDIVSAFQFVLKDIFGDFEGSDEQGLKGFFLALKKLAIEVFPLVVFLTKTFIQQLILQIQLFRGVFGDVASFVYNIVSFLVTNMIQQVNAAIFFFDAFMQQMSMIKIIILGVALFFVKYWGEILNSIFPVIGAVEYLINKIQFLKGILSGLSIPGFDAGQLQNRVAAQARPQAPQSPSTGRAGSVTNNASVGAVNVTVTQTPASPGQITSAVQGGISQGLQEALENANRNLEGGFT